MLKKIGFLTFGQGFNILVNLLFLPYMSRALSYEDYGTYGQVVLIIGTLTTFLSFGLPQIINVQFSRTEVDFKIVLSNNIVLGVLLGFLGVVLLYSFQQPIASFFKNEGIKSSFLIYSWSLLFAIPFNSFNTYLIYQGKVKQSVWVSIVPNLLKVAGVIAAVHYLHTVESIIYVLLAISIIQFVWCVILAFEHLSLKVQRKLMKEQFHQGFPLGLTAIIGVVMLYLDSMMVSNMLGVKEYAIFRNGAFEVPFLGTLYASISTVILPEVAKLWQQGKKQEIAELKGKAILNTALLVYPVLGVLIFYSQQLIVWYFGTAYTSSAIIFSVYNLTLIIRVNNYSDVLIAAGKSKSILYANLISVVINGILNYFLILKFQAVGAAFSTVASLFFLASMLLVVNGKLLNNNLSTYLNFKKTSFVLFVSLFSAFVFSYLIPKFLLQSMSKYYILASVLTGFVSQYLIYWQFGIIDKNVLTLIKRKFLNR